MCKKAGTDNVPEVWTHRRPHKSIVYPHALNNVQEPRTCLRCWWRNFCLSWRGLISSRNVPERTSFALRHPAARPCLAHLHSSDLCHASLLTWLTESCGITAGLNVETMLTSIWLSGSGGGQEQEMQKRKEGSLLSDIFHYILILYYHHLIYIYFYYLCLCFSTLFSCLSLNRLQEMSIDISSKTLEYMGNPWCSCWRKML